MTTRPGIACFGPAHPARDDPRATAPPAIVLMNVLRSCGLRLIALLAAPPI
ncbi:MAG: hypothetical protein MZV64_63940 [Ignavibacteriales bacterium]|nr:hypothetical protein [Ignavibacteriales bacterium]